MPGAGLRGALMLDGLLDQLPANLSSGQRQRAGVAALLGEEADVHPPTSRSPTSTSTAGTPSCANWSNAPPGGRCRSSTTATKAWTSASTAW
ncbi:hypothetical protein JGS22_025235 [Streptomyces sp. P38-E01]|uniref:ABC transporter domain-containing protein n=1 Tax=Streptomyces tardus TaxID=2780544 RepID=A0A949JIL4_9ACTN|nr:hypothetical protein [Streptomyces tardus]MBU7600833.1 hypothetical protein [Streptomyces tardus]